MNCAGADLTAKRDADAGVALRRVGIERVRVDLNMVVIVIGIDVVEVGMD